VRPVSESVCEPAVSAQDPYRGTGAAESVVDVDRHESARAARERAVERGRSSLCHPVTDRRRHGDDRSVDQSGKDAEQRALHPGHRDHDLEASDLVQPAHQPPQPGNTDVGDDGRLIAGELKRARRFPRDGKIGGPCTHDAGAVHARRDRRSVDCGERERVVIEPPPSLLAQAGQRRLVETRQEQAALAGACDDRLDLRRRLAVAQDGLRDPGAALTFPVEFEIAHATSSRRNAAPRR
jgi:hypothetical protein